MSVRTTWRSGRRRALLPMIKKVIHPTRPYFVCLYHFASPTMESGVRPDCLLGFTGRWGVDREMGEAPARRGAADHMAWRPAARSSPHDRTGNPSMTPTYIFTVVVSFC
jgi:hypothetical protein